MRYVILRDDDTCALTPVACLETLYRPFLDRGLPVNLATIPNVCTEARRPNGQREGFLQFNSGSSTPFIPIGLNQALVEYLLGEPLYHVLHHGYDHSLYEFDCSAAEAEHRQGFAAPCRATRRTAGTRGGVDGVVLARCGRRWPTSGPSPARPVQHRRSNL